MSAASATEQAGVIASGLAVRRGGRLLFSGLSFGLAPGDVMLLTGSNGAGKSSLLLTLCGAVRAEEGRVELRGAGPDAQPETALHYVGHAAAVKGALTVAENLRFWAELYGRPGDGVGDALAKVGLGELVALPAGYLSAGQTRRLALARLLVSPRPIWLLDEPTAALDTAGAALVGGLISAHAAGGGIVIAATHDPLEISGAVRRLALGALA
jgi:heme exporter protein A